MSETVLTNAKLVLPDQVIETGTVVLRDGHIAEISEGVSTAAGAQDCDGDYLAPGLIELHTDNLERHISPRPKVDWPHHAAVVAHDAELASCGITTVFDAVRVGSIHHQSRGGENGYKRYARQLTTEILAMRDAGALKISHHLHLRAEICSQTLLEELEEFGEADRVGLVSLMDHTPGQRQFADVSKFEDYVRGKSGISKESFDEYVTYLKELQAEIGAKHEAGAVAAAKRFGAVLASHDDTTQDQVAVSAGYGVSLAEFPTTEIAAAASQEAGIAVMMGAPNLVRGGSHSGNVSAIDLASSGRLDILSSDYVPAALMMGAVMLGRYWNDMARGMATVTSAPAAAANLNDRGKLETGLRADLLRFKVTEEGFPVIAAVWSQARQVG
ncbi:MAG: alpha-D-ribose 1-methylphosphonate 5-triphosphate diphosphatase [Mangrovicoccus sp.]